MCWQDDRAPDMDETAKALVNSKILESADKVGPRLTKNTPGGRCGSRPVTTDEHPYHGRFTCSLDILMCVACFGWILVQDVRLYAATCLADILRIYAPDAPYSSPVLLVSQPDRHPCRRKGGGVQDSAVKRHLVTSGILAGPLFSLLYMRTWSKHAC